MARIVYLFHAGDDPEDRKFVQHIADHISPFCLPQLIDIDQLERMDDANELRPERFRGVPVFVLSPTMLRRPFYRHKLSTATPGRNLPGRSVFYICRCRNNRFASNIPILEFIP